MRSAADSVLPFTSRDVVVSRTYHEDSQTGRGAMPETGGSHLVTTNGDDYTVRPSGGCDDLRPGPYRLQLSRVKHLIMKYRQTQ